MTRQLGAKLRATPPALAAQVKNTNIVMGSFKPTYTAIAALHDINSLKDFSLLITITVNKEINLEYQDK